MTTARQIHRISAVERNGYVVCAAPTVVAGKCLIRLFIVFPDGELEIHEAGLPLGDVPDDVAAIVADHTDVSPLPVNSARLPDLAGLVPHASRLKWDIVEFPVLRHVLASAKYADCRAAMSMLISRLNKQLVEHEFLSKISTHEYNLLAQNGHRSISAEKQRSVRDIYCRHPWLRYVCSIESTMWRAELVDQSFFDRHPDEVAADLIDKQWMHLYPACFVAEPRAVKRLAGLNLNSKFNSAQVLVLSSMPPSWVKNSLTEWNGHILKAISGHLGRSTFPTPDVLADLISSTHGRLDIVAKKLRDEKYVQSGDTAGQIVSNALNDAADMIAAFRTDVLSPLLEHEDIYPEDPGIDEVAHALLNFRTLNQLFKLSEKWHKDEGAMRQKINGFEGWSWPPLCQPFISSEGLVVRALTSAEELHWEGSKSSGPDGVMGLSHCVGSYPPNCIEGVSHVLSIRAPHGNSLKRLSTVEIKVHNGIHNVVQHRAFSNTTPTTEAVTALREWHRAILDGSIRLNPEALATKDRNVVKPDNETSVDRAITVWAGYLKPHFRAMNTTQLVAEIGELWKLYRDPDCNPLAA